MTIEEALPAEVRAEAIETDRLARASRSRAEWSDAA
jgi:hypothetical protein